MARLTEREIREHLQAFAQEMHIRRAISQRAIDGIASVYEYASARAADATTAAAHRYWEDIFLQRVAVITDAHAANLREVANRPLPKPKLSLGERIDRFILGEPGTPLYDGADKLTRSIFR